MSVPAVAANHARSSSGPVAYLPLPWTAPEEHDDFELSGVTMHFAADHQVYEEGDEARYFYKVVSGVVRTCRFLKDGRRQIDAFHQAGDVFGFEAGTDHGMAAEAVTDCLGDRLPPARPGSHCGPRRSFEPLVLFPCVDLDGERPGTLAAAGACQRVAEDRGLPGGNRSALGQRRRDRAGDEPARYCGLSGADD